METSMGRLQTHTPWQVFSEREWFQYQLHIGTVYCKETKPKRFGKTFPNFSEQVHFDLRSGSFQLYYQEEIIWDMGYSGEPEIDLDSDYKFESCWKQGAETRAY